jgi:dienelactone hydrolase
MDTEDITRRGFLKTALGALGLAAAKAVSWASGANANKPQASSSADGRRINMASTQPSQDFFDSRKHLMDYCVAHPRRMGLTAKTAKELKTWASAARAKFVELTGFDRMTPVEPNPRQTQAVDCGNYVREHWLIDTEPDVTMPFYLLRPKGLVGPAPAVICCHGHGGGKETTVGITEEGNAAKAVAINDAALGVQFVRAGMLAFCPDARGFGQRREIDARKNPSQSSCAFLQMVGLPMGLSVIGMHAFDLARLVDHMQARDDVRPDRIGCVGFSGGGWQALAAGVVDERPACVVISGYLHPVAAPLLFRKHNCLCNMVPHLWEYFELGDLAALIAPRPLLVQTGDEDDLSGPAGPADVQPQVDIARQAYQLLGCPEHLEFNVFHGGHRWDGVKAIPWVGKWLTS